MDNGFRRFKVSCILNNEGDKNMLFVANVDWAIGSGSPNRLVALGNFPDWNKTLAIFEVNIKFELNEDAVLKEGKEDARDDDKDDGKDADKDVAKDDGMEVDKDEGIFIVTEGTANNAGFSVTSSPV